VEPPLEKETQKYEISSHVTERMSDQNAFSEEKAKFKKKKDVLSCLHWNIFGKPRPFAEDEHS
jgi:hypothetical protein